MATYTRRYVQYNDLPFDNYEMLRSWDDTTVKFKQESSQYTFKHGSYVAFKSETMLVEETNVSMTILLEMQRLACDKRTYYRKYVLDNFNRPGKLWAVQNGELCWAYAYPENYSEAASTSLANSILIDIDFVLYEGIWHKANAFTTFLEPYDLCEDMEYTPSTDQCIEYNDKKDADNCVNSCVPKAKCSCTCESKPTMFDNDCGCDCGAKDKRKNLCEVDLNLFYGSTGCDTTGYKIIEDCSAYTTESGETIGTKFRGEPCNGYLSGKVYANTDVPTTDYEITVTGVFHNLYVAINGNGNYISGDYEGTLMFRGDGSIWYLNGDCGWQELPVSDYIIPDGMDFGFTFNPGWNTFTIDAGACDCNHTMTAYINIDNITY